MTRLGNFDSKLESFLTRILPLDKILTFFLGENGKIIYSLDDESIFTLEQYEDQSGSHLDLIPVGVIDREKFKTAELKMTASNPTIPNQMDQSTTVTIHITVLDENEFKPTFTKQVSIQNLSPVEIIVRNCRLFAYFLDNQMGNS